MQVGFYFNQSRCTGCADCQVACKAWHDIPAGPEQWIRVNYTEKGKFPDVFVSHLVSTCYQCLDPVCIPACPTRAIAKRKEDGIVLVNSELCLGNIECNVKCLKACPYDAPQFGPETGAKMSKCNFCLD
ncbi:MAG: 4Fe-4S dicluster domain-containing protein, partial [Chloroflexota bacterium]|nr:4Fe-4S dicluster domain-containing protein [Chloroflexota bacterium]